MDRRGDVPELVADPTVARKELGFDAPQTLETMCRDLWNWQTKNPKGYGGPDELKAAIGDLEQIFSDRSGTVSTDVSDTDTHARWFTGRKPG